MNRLLCAAHTAWVDVLDRTTVHAHDGQTHHNDDDPLSTRDGRVTTPGRVRAERERTTGREATTT